MGEEILTRQKTSLPFLQLGDTILVTPSFCIKLREHEKWLYT